MKYYEVHEIEDTLSGEPRYCMSYRSYRKALKMYKEIDREGQPARLLLVDKDGMPIDELMSNYD